MSRIIYQRFKSARDLPSPTGVALRLLELARSEKSTVAEVAKVIETDPAISVRLLRLANSAFSGVGQRVASIQRAVVLLGMKTVTQLALCFSLVSKNREGRCQGFNYEWFWSDSLGRAVASRHFAARLRCTPGDEAFTCGLLSQIGRLAFATACPEPYAKVIANAPEEAVAAVLDLELAEFELTHADLAAEMLADWGLPEDYSQAVRGQYDPDACSAATEGALAMARVLQAAGMVSRVLTKSSAYREALAELTLKANRLGLAPEVLLELFDRIRTDWRDLGSLMSVRTEEVPSLAELYEDAKRAREAMAEPLPKPTASGVSVEGHTS